MLWLLPIAYTMAHISAKKMRFHVSILEMYPKDWGAGHADGSLSHQRAGGSGTLAKDVGKFS